MKLRKKKTPVRPRLELVGALEGVFRVWCEGLTPGKTYQLWGTVSDAHRPTKDPTVQAIATFEAEAEQQLVRIGFPKLAVDWRTSLRLILELHDKEDKMLTCLFCDRKTDLNDGWRPVMASCLAPRRMPRRFWKDLILYVAGAAAFVAFAIIFWYIAKGVAAEEGTDRLLYGFMGRVCEYFAAAILGMGAYDLCLNMRYPWWEKKNSQDKKDEPKKVN